MRISGMVVLVALTGFSLLSPPSLAQCVKTSAPANTLMVAGYHFEERQICSDGSTFADRSQEKVAADGLRRLPGCGYEVVPPTSPPPPGWGFLFGQGTWMYEETNLIPGLQAGGFGIIAEAPDCSFEVILLDPGCIVFNETIEDETCGAGTGGPDRLILLGWIPR